MVDLRNQYGANFNYGQNVSMPTSQFTKEKQEQIIDNYFNKSGSLYGQTVGSFVQEGETPVQQENTQQALIDAAELDRLRRMEELVKSGQMPASPNYAQTRNEQPLQQQQNELPPQQAQQPQSEDPFDKFMKELNGGTSTQNVQQPQQPSQQPGQDDSVNERIISEITRAATLKGHRADNVLDFINKLTPEDFVTMYDAFLEASNKQIQQQQAPQRVSQPQRQPLNVSEMPRASNPIDSYYTPNNTARNPYFN